MTHLENDPLKLVDRGRLGDQVPHDRGVPRASTTSRSRTRASRCSTSRTTTSPARGRSTTCSSGAAWSSASPPTRTIDEAMTTPPQTTRARLRGAFIKRAKERKRDYTVDWVHLKLNDQAQRTVLCKDPFKSRDDRVERLIASSVARTVDVPSFRTGEVVELLEERPGLQRVEVDLGDGPERAYVLTQLTGPVALGDRGRREHHRGRARARHRRLARRALEPRARRVAASAGPGHIIKGRYTSLQADVGSTEEHLEALAEVDSIDGMPVVAAALHSQLPAVAAAFKRPRARRPPRVRDDRRRRPAARAVGPRRRRCATQDLARRHRHVRPRVRRRLRGGVGATPRSRSRATSRTPTPRSSRWGRASSAPTPGSGSAAWRSARSSTPRTRSAASPIACLRVSFADGRDRATTGSRTTAPPRCALATPRAGAGRGAARSATPSRRAARAPTSPPPASTAATSWSTSTRPTRSALFARHGLRVASMGRPAADDPALFQAAAAAGALRGRTSPRDRTRDG